MANSKVVLLGFKEVLLLLLVTFSLVKTDDDCDYPPGHTMCIYDPQACPGATLIRYGVTDDDRDDIVAAHNRLRSKVATGREPKQPQASNMMELLYDDELEKIAQRWAEQCILGHDKKRNLKSGEYVGQNVAIWSASYDGLKKNFTRATEYWYSEVVDPGFDAQFIKPYKFNEGYGHYTQVVWATTAYVGCGYSYYSTVSASGKTKYKSLYVCNYTPGGNLIGGTMYKVGSPASDCPQGISNNYEGLCANQ